ncbi:unnamed protein product [Anisakis simplex]|uniref:Scaffolding protein n=1 Tax=Anisakis simplex TaxID=6269 RepID=A0A0M3KKN5_ANISI|nr:unnamed protein product [Anisakis simplex]
MEAIYRTLSNPDQMSTDEGSSGEDSDNEELATKLESMLAANKDNEELATKLESMLAANKGKKGLSAVERKKLEFEQEEKERKALQKMLSGDASSGTGTPKPEKDQTKEPR